MLAALILCASLWFSVGCSSMGCADLQSLYQEAVESGFQGTYQDFINGKKGDPGEKGAPGEKGESGDTPYIGANGNWWIGNQDTGVCADGMAAGSAGLFEYYPIGGVGEQCLGYSVAAGRAKYIEHLVIPEQIKGKPVLRIEAAGFKNCAARSLYIPESVNEIGEEAFYNCKYLSEVTIDVYGKLERVENRAFYGCTNIRNILFDGSTKYMGEEVFSASDVTLISCGHLEKPEDWAENWNGGCAVNWGVLGNGVTNVLEGISFQRFRLNAGETENVDMNELLADCSIRPKVAWLKSSDSTVAAVAGDRLIGVGTGRTGLSICIGDGNKQYSKQIGEIVVVNEVDFYPVDSAEDLMQIRYNLDGKYRLAADIDLKGIEWEPLGKIGQDEEAFTGMFINPQGYSVRNLTLTDVTKLHKGYAGLFGCAENAYFEGIRLENIFIDVRSYIIGDSMATVGGLCGVSGRGSMFVECSVQGSVWGQNRVGGLVGSDSWGVYERCSFEGMLEARLPEGMESNVACYAGGIAGYIGGNPDEKQGAFFCRVNAEIISDLAAGGIAGRCWLSLLQNCSFTGKLQAPVTDENNAE